MSGWEQQPSPPEGWFSDAPQYEAPQYDAPRYDAPPYYDAGGAGPVEAPGHQGEPGRRRTGLLVGLGALALVLLLAVGTIVVVGNRGDDTADAGSSSSPVASSGSSSSPPANTPEAQAKAVDDLLSRAAGGKNQLATAYEQANSCEISPASAETKFEDAAKNRRGIVASARKLDTSKIDNGPRVKSLLISMYSTSAKADDAFAAWARAGDQSGESCLKSNAKRKKGNTLSIKAGKTKKKFVKAWNPVAEQYGHTKRTKNGL